MKKFLKQFGGIMIGLLIFGGVFAAGLVQRNNSKLELSQFRMLFTNDGTIGGTEVFDINSGGNIIAYGPLVDGAMNPYITGMNLSGYITGYTETDPIWMIDSGNYIPRTETGTYYQIMPSTRIQDAGANYIMQGTDISISALGGEFRTLGIGLSISINSGYGAIIDNRTSPRGIEYWNDYSTGFTDYSLVHKKYVAENYMSIADSGTYVPYTGATTDVYLGGNSIYASNAYLQFGGMGVVRTAGGLRAALGGIGEGTFYVANTNTGVILDVNQLTQDRTISFPDATGTIMLDTTMSGYVPRANIDTGFNNTGSDTIIPSEKAVWGLMDGLTDTYIPYRSGDKFYDSNMFRFNANTTYINSFLVFTGVSQGLFITKGDIGVEQYGDDTNAIAGSSFGGGAGIAGTAYSSGTNPGGYGLVGYLGDSNPLSVQLRLINPTGSYTGNALEINNTAGPNTGNVARIEKQGNIHTVGAYHLTGGTTPWRIIVSGDNLSFQAYTGGNRVEKGFFTP